MDYLEIKPRFKEFLEELRCDKDFTHYRIDSDYVYLYNISETGLTYVDAISIYRVLKFIIKNLD